MTLDEKQKQIIATFAALDDWLEKYDHLIDLGRSQPPLSPEQKTDANAVPGCQSSVWLSVTEENGLLQMAADSDSMITRGILALLVQVCTGQPPGEVAEADPYFIREIGLSTNLSPARQNGLQTIVQQIQMRARAVAETAAT